MALTANVEWSIAFTRKGPPLPTERPPLRVAVGCRRPFGFPHEANACAVSWFDQLANQTHLKKDIQLACHFLYLAPADFAEHRS
jgi:hypothetical protein